MVNQENSQIFSLFVDVKWELIVTSSVRRTCVNTVNIWPGYIVFTATGPVYKKNMQLCSAKKSYHAKYKSKL